MRQIKMMMYTKFFQMITNSYSKDFEKARKTRQKMGEMSDKSNVRDDG